MLEQAIIDNPNEPSYRIKILEVLAAMDNLEEFREQAVKAEEIIGLNTVEWANIKSLWEGLKKSSEEKNLEQSKEFVDDEREADGEIAEKSKQQISDTGESGESVQSGENLTSTDAAAFEIDLDIDEQDDSSLSIHPVDDKKE